MKLRVFIIIFILSLTCCAEKDLVKDQVKKETGTETVSKSESVNTGWSDTDTYTVKVIAENVERGKEKARHQILQDIVKIRMLNESRFTDITKINAEFDKPLKEGRVISEKKTEAGVEIYFQIKDEGLKMKFEKR